jgi:integrase
VRKLKGNGGLINIHWYQFRHTIATWLENQGHDPYDRAIALNHAQGGVTAGDSHGHAMKRKVAVLEAWAAHVQALVKVERVRVEVD